MSKTKLNLQLIADPRRFASFSYFHGIDFIMLIFNNL